MKKSTANSHPCHLLYNNVVIKDRSCVLLQLHDAGISAYFFGRLVQGHLSQTLGCQCFFLSSQPLFSSKFPLFHDKLGNFTNNMWNKIIRSTYCFHSHVPAVGTPRTTCACFSASLPEWLIWLLVTTSWYGEELDHPQRPSKWQHNKVHLYLSINTPPPWKCSFFFSWSPCSVRRW